GANWTPDSLVTVDFNGDGKLDLAAASDGTYDPNSRTYTNGSVLVLLGNGDGTFQVPATYGVGLYPASVAVVDFNSDSIPDIAVANKGSTNISLLLGKGDGSFLDAVNYRAGVNPWSVAVGDFNGDGKPD